MSAWLIAILISATLLVPQYAPPDGNRTTGGSASCPVTVPNEIAPPSVDSPERFYGNGSVFTSVPDGGIKRAITDLQGNGGSDKLIFYRLPIGEELAITVEPFGDRQVSQAARLHPAIGQEQYIYQVAGVWFPEEGCWEITAQTSDAILTVVMYVIFVSAIEADMAPPMILTNPA